MITLEDQIEICELLTQKMLQMSELILFSEPVDLN